MDLILKTLTDQRIFAAKEFLQNFCPVGGHFSFNGQECIVEGYDLKTGFLNVQPVNGGFLTPPNPLDIVFSNAVANPAIAPTTAATSGGASLGSILPSLATPASMVIPLIKGKAAKGAAGAAGSGTGSGVYQSGMYGGPNGSGSSLLADPSSQLQAAQQNLSAATSQVDKLLGVPYSSISTNAIDLAKGNAFSLYDTTVKDLQQKIGSINQQLNDIMGSTSVPLDYTASQKAIMQGLDVAKSSYQKTLDNLLGADGQKAFVDGQVSNFSNAVGQMNDAQAQLTEMQDLSNAYSDRVTSFNQSANDTVGKAFSDISNTSSLSNTPGWYQSGVTKTTQTLVQEGKLVPYQYDDNGNILTDAAGNRVGNYDPTESITTQTAAYKQVTDRYQTDLVKSLSNPSAQDIAGELSAAKQDAWNSGFVDRNKYATPDSLPDADPYVQENLNYRLSAKSDALTQQKLNALNAEANKNFQAQLRSQEIQFGTEMFGAGMAAYGEERALDSMFQNGFSFKGLLEVVGAGGGMYLALHMANKLLIAPDSALLKTIQNLPFLGHQLGSFLKFISSGYGFLALQAAIIFFGWLFGHKQPSPEQEAAETLNAEVNPVVWNQNGSVVFLTAGLTLATMGLNLTPSAPMMQTLTLTQAQATEALVSAGAGSVPTDGTRYANVFVQPGALGQATRVVFLTPSGTDSKGNVIEKVTVETLNQNFQFATSQPTNYVPFFINGPNGKQIPNPQVVQSLSNQQHLLQCADGTWVTDATRCAAAAGAVSHSGS